MANSISHCDFCEPRMVPIEWCSVNNATKFAMNKSYLSSELGKENFPDRKFEKNILIIPFERMNFNSPF